MSRIWRDDATWNARLDDVATFVAEHDGRFPSVGSKDRHEHKIAVWMRNQKSGANTDAPWLTPERREAMDERIPGWSDGGGRQSWETRMDQTAAFVAEHSRLPSTKAPQESERTLGWWLARTRQWLRTNDPRLSASRKKALDRAIPRWR